MSECLDQGDILEYLDRTGTPPDIAAHVRECDACRALLDRLDEGVRASIRRAAGWSEYTLPVLGEDRRVLGEARLWSHRSKDRGEDCALLFEWEGATYRSAASDYLRALKALRDALSPEGLDVLCNGSLVNVFASGMLADSSSALKVYLLVLGEPATPRHVVATFEQPSEPYTIGTPREQDEFLDRYLASLGT